MVRQKAEVEVVVVRPRAEVEAVAAAAQQEVKVKLVQTLFVERASHMIDFF